MSTSPAFARAVAVGFVVGQLVISVVVVGERRGVGGGEGIYSAGFGVRRRARERVPWYM